MMTIHRTCPLLIPYSDDTDDNRHRHLFSFLPSHLTEELFGSHFQEKGWEE